jgi:uncharacterized protein with HEPN domain
MTRSSFGPRDALNHILDETIFLAGVRERSTRATFVHDEVLRRAAVRSLEVIGEAVKRVPAEILAAAPEVDWRRVAGMRDRLIHGYFSVDYELVWDAIATHVPTLGLAVKRLLGGLSQDGDTLR